MIEENGENEKKPKKIEIIKGNSKDLNISEVRDNLVIERPEETQKQTIVIPESIEHNDSDDSNNNK